MQKDATEWMGRRWTREERLNSCGELTFDGILYGEGTATSWWEVHRRTAVDNHRTPHSHDLAKIELRSDRVSKQHLMGG